MQEDKEMKYAGKKLLTMFLTLFAVTLFVFLAFHVISGDPVSYTHLTLPTKA